MEASHRQPIIPSCDRSHVFNAPELDRDHQEREAAVAAKLARLVAQLPADIRHRDLGEIVLEDIGLPIGEATYRAMQAIDGFPTAEQASQSLPEDAVA